MDCFASLAMTAKTPPSLIPVRDGAARHQPVPDEQHHQRADGRGDEAGALVGAVMADGLADKGRQKRAGNAEHGGEDEAARIVRTRRKQSRDDSGYEADDDDPENAAHCCRPPCEMPSFKKPYAPIAREAAGLTAGLIIRFRSVAVRPASDG